jgi:hypothetical protein
MRLRGHFWLPAVLSLAILVPSTAAADTILITSGFLEMGTGSSAFDLVGDSRSFRLFGTGYLGGFSPNAFVFCPDEVCDPGDSALLQHAAGGLDLPATATLDGVTYADVGALGRSSAELGFSSTSLLPPLDGTAVVRSPFTMEGSFSAEDLSSAATLQGSGIVTTTWNTFGSDVWTLTSARYDFSANAAPVPEPGTLVLLGMAGGAAALRRRRQRAG